MSATVNSPEAARPTAADTADPVVRLLERLDRLSQSVPPSQRGMSEEINKLLQAAREPGATESPEFRTQVAYLLQDFPRFSGYRLQVVVKHPLGQELSQLASTYPGLENRAVQSLVRATSLLTDRSLIADIRRTAAIIAREGTGRQNSLLAEDEVRRLQPRVEANDAALVAGMSAEPATQDAPIAVPRDVPVRPREPEPAPTAFRPSEEAARPAGDRIAPAAEARSRPAAPPEASQEKAVGVEGPPMRGAAPVSGSPGNGAGTILGARFAALSARVAQEKVAELMQVTEAAGTAAVEALGAFHKGPGKEFLAKIEEAATQDPGGMDAVIAGMTPGGQYSGLRREFDDRLKNDRSFVQAYNDVERTVEKYGRKRVQTTEEALRREIDVAPIDAKFQQSDAEVARHLRGIPGREPGRSMLQELTQQAMQVLTRAFQVVQDLLARNPKPDRRPSPGPSPS